MFHSKDIVVKSIRESAGSGILTRAASMKCGFERLSCSRIPSIVVDELSEKTSKTPETVKSWFRGDIYRVNFWVAAMIADGLDISLDTLGSIVPSTAVRTSRSLDERDVLHELYKLEQLFSTREDLTSRIGMRISCRIREEIDLALKENIGPTMGGVICNQEIVIIERCSTDVVIIVPTLTRFLDDHDAVDNARTYPLSPYVVYMAKNILNGVRYHFVISSVKHDANADIQEANATLRAHMPTGEVSRVAKQCSFLTTEKPVLCGAVLHILNGTSIAQDRDAKSVVDGFNDLGYLVNIGDDKRSYQTIGHMMNASRRTRGGMLMDEDYVRHFWDVLESYDVGIELLVR